MTNTYAQIQLVGKIADDEIAERTSQSSLDGVEHE